jgi:hypothetical protein
MSKRVIDASKWTEVSAPSQKTVSKPTSVVISQPLTRVTHTYKPPFPQPRVQQEVLEDPTLTEHNSYHLAIEPHISGFSVEGCKSIEDAYDKNKERIHFKCE